LNDSLVCYENSTVQLRGKKADELFSTSRIFKLEHASAEIVQKGLLEKHVNQFKAEAWFKLV